MSPTDLLAIDPDDLELLLDLADRACCLAECGVQLYAQERGSGAPAVESDGVEQAFLLAIDPALTSDQFALDKLRRVIEAHRALLFATGPRAPASIN
jgi:hypothetical protein